MTETGPASHHKEDPSTTALVDISLEGSISDEGRDDSLTETPGYTLPGQDDTEDSEKPEPCSLYRLLSSCCPSRTNNEGMPPNADSANSMRAYLTSCRSWFNCRRRHQQPNNAIEHLDSYTIG